MVQIKVTASVLLAAAAVAPTVAYGFDADGSLVTREDNEFASSYARGFDDLDLKEREFDDELYEREPLGGGLVRTFIRVGRKHAGSAASSAFTTPQSLNERGSRRGGTSRTPPSEETRELEDDLLEREVDEELYPRRGGGGRGYGGHSYVQREVDEELYPRRGGGGGNGYGGHSYVQRDVDLELFEREPEPFLFIDHIKKWWKNRKAKNATPPADDAAAAPDTRSVDEMELLEREYYDELD